MLEEGREGNILAGVSSADVGPEAKEYYLLRADEEYRNGNVEHSIYYQVKAQFHATDMRYITEAAELEKRRPTTQELMKSASNQEKGDFKSKKFLRNIIKHLQQVEQQKPPEMPTEEDLDYMDFLEGSQNPTEGLTRIMDICHRMPDEWCILHLCKSFNPATTYSVFNEIMASDGAIYLSLLRHCRSPQLGPIGLRFAGSNMANLFREYSTMVERFRRVVTVDPLNVKSKEAKQKYWEELKVFDTFLQKLQANFRDIISPYSFLFFGKRYDCSGAQKQAKIIYSRVDDFCLLNQWSTHQRVLLSQAALHANRLDSANLKLICYELSSNENEIQSVYDMLKEFASEWNQVEERQPLVGRRFPTILVVDERLDHFHWEQLVTVQEFTRIKSLHCLWRLFQIHKSNISHGYYTTNIKQGMCIINPDADLVNSGRRLRSFFEYWLSQWQHLFETVPNEEVVLKQALQSDCFVYAGHGSGLQYVNGRTISRARVQSVVFLFGCDSTRMLSTGLYSALYGAHDYYHGAQCPSIVGTLMPALDGNMDTVSVTVLSLWLAPGNKQVIPWTQIDRVPWLKSGIIKGKVKTTTTMSDEPNYHLGSLCSIMSLVQQGKVEPNTYNCCIYVCRGLPAWNLAVEKMPL
ncbi:separin homolog sep-1 [Drosophila rhopaloa]|uniref:separase n=1 Tax=Drosophila rhopaloa TaxID=1041015 RepID=A0A6P4FBT5_DRORH|nr:separin homolog sep-1 [Drosophila rhopaloa]